MKASKYSPSPSTSTITRFRFHSSGRTSPWIEGNPFEWRQKIGRPYTLQVLTICYLIMDCHLSSDKTYNKQFMLTILTPQAYDGVPSVIRTHYNSVHNHEAHSYLSGLSRGHDYFHPSYYSFWYNRMLIASMHSWHACFDMQKVDNAYSYSIMLYFIRYYTVIITSPR